MEQLHGYLRFDQSPWTRFPDGSIALDPGPHGVCFATESETAAVALRFGFVNTPEGQGICAECAKGKDSA